MTPEPTTLNTPYGEGRPLVLFAVEPRSYAQAIGGATARLRPGIDVRVVEPEDLVSEMGLSLPVLVFCGKERPDGCDGAVRWARYSPYEEPEVVRVDGVPHRFPGLALGDLLRLVDLYAAGPAVGRPTVGRPGDAPRTACRTITDSSSGEHRRTERA